LTETTSIIELNEIKRALALATELDDVIDLRNKAEAARHYAAIAGHSLEMQNYAAEAKIHAERRAGEMLSRMDKLHGGRPSLLSLHDESPIPITDLGISHIQSHRWQQEASIPEDTVDDYLETAKANNKEITTPGLMRFDKKQKQVQERAQTTANLLDNVTTDRQYQTIVIDPPWQIQKITRQVRPRQDRFAYPTMTLDEIAKLPIPDLAFSEGCHVYLWVTHKYLPAGLNLFRDWGVKYQCLMTWVKPSGFTPFSWMYNTEHVLFGRIGNLQLNRMGIKLSFEAPVTGHSRKPDEFFRIVRQASPEPRINLFAREQRPGFYAWGKEVNDKLATVES
jgi:N6-adenosine-specific RNA methylase IME4